MDTASEIKSRISMRQIIERYGIKLERGSYINCPFHTEKTPSLKVYDQPGKGFCCFGCGAVGSVIDFVMRLYGIDFRQAVLRIASDFGISTGTTRAGMRERRQWQRQQIEKQKQEHDRQEQLLDLAAEHCRLWQIVKGGEIWSDQWCKAITRLPMIDWQMEMLSAKEQNIQKMIT